MQRTKKSNTMLSTNKQSKRKRYPLSVYHLQMKRKTLREEKRGRYPGITARKKRIVGRIKVPRR
jgi:hypothetical protein